MRSLILGNGDLEFYLAGTRFAYAMSSSGLSTCFPQFNRNGIIDFQDLANPLLLLQEECTPTPVDINLTRDEFGAVITGPNNGGKSVALRAVGLGYQGAMCGYPIAATRADLHLIDGLFTHFLTSPTIPDHQHFSHNADGDLFRCFGLDFQPDRRVDSGDLFLGYASLLQQIGCR